MFSDGFCANRRISDHIKECVGVPTMDINALGFWTHQRFSVPRRERIKQRIGKDSRADALFLSAVGSGLVATIDPVLS